MASKSVQSRGKPDSDRTSFKEICDLVCGNLGYYNIFAQIVSCYKNKRGNIVLRVWDGTRNKQQCFNSASRDLKLIYGDENREKLIAAQRKLYDVVLYDNHGQVALNLNAGDYIALINVHFYIPTNCFLPNLCMHGGSGIVRNAKSLTEAGRKIIKITKEISETGYNYIDQLIKEHEKSLIEMEEREKNKAIQAPSNVNEEAEDDGFYDEWIDPIEIPTTSSPPKQNKASVTVAVQTSQTINSSIIRSTQSGAVLSQHSTNTSNKIVAPASTQSSTPPTITVAVQTSTQPSTINSSNTPKKCAILSQQSSDENVSTILTQSTFSNIQETISQPQVVEKPISTVSNNSSTSAVRRPASVAFSEVEQLASSRPPKCICVHGASSNIEGTEENENFGGTQNLFDKLKPIPSTQEEEEDDDDEEEENLEISMSEENKALNAITDSQLDKMWEIAENAHLQPSYPKSQFN